MDLSPRIDSESLLTADREWHVLARRVRIAKGFCFIGYSVDAPAVALDIEQRLREYAKARGGVFIEVRTPNLDDLTRFTISRIYTAVDILSEASGRPVIWVDTSGFGNSAESKSAIADLLSRLNEQRSRLENEIAGVLVFLLPAGLLPLVGSHAPDLWHIRSHSGTLRQAPFDIVESVVVDDEFATASSDGRIDGIADASLNIFASIHDAWPIHPPLLTKGLSRWIGTPLSHWIASFRPASGRQDLQHIQRNLRFGRLNAATKSVAQLLQAEQGDTDSPARGPASLSFLAYFEGILSLAGGAFERAIDRFELSCVLSRRSGNKVGEFVALDMMASTFLVGGNLPQGQSAFSKAESVASNLIGGTIEGVCSARIGSIFYLLGDLERGRTHLERALGRFMEDGNWRAEMITLCDLGQIAIRRGQPQSSVNAREVRIEDLGQLLRRDPDFERRDSTALFDSALRVAKVNRSDFAGIVMLNLRLAEIYLENGPGGLRNSFKHINEAFEILREADVNPKRFDLLVTESSDPEVPDVGTLLKPFHEAIVDDRMATDLDRSRALLLSTSKLLAARILWAMKRRDLAQKVLADAVRAATARDDQIDLVLAQQLREQFRQGAK